MLSTNLNGPVANPQYPRCFLLGQTMLTPTIIRLFKWMKMSNKLKIIAHLSNKSIQIIKTEGFVIFCHKFLRKIYRRFVRVYIKNRLVTVKEMLNERFSSLQPIPYIKVERDSYRFNIVTDSIKKPSLFGGVATSLILATLFSNKYKIPLRIIVRTTENNPLDFEEFLKLMKINKPEKVEYFSDYDGSGKYNYKLEVSDKDIFLSTSWWTSEAVKKINLRKKFFYILQEVETFFYPNGDDQYLCNNILHDQNINYILNSKFLFDYYLENKFNNVVHNGIYFEPAFEKHLYSSGKDSFEKKQKFTLFFYARPNNPRNLFYTGLKIIDKAVSSGLINHDEWDIYFGGSDLPPLEFSDGTKPIVLGKMRWEEYCEFLKTVDLGFCLMFTPHPSYPPFDIAASGGIVLTNKYANKKTIQSSKNIICRNLDDDSMLKGFEDAIKLAKNSQARKKNYQENNIEQSWDHSLKDVIEFINTRK
jgi:O-antigen biosynthesis protein